MTQEIITEYLKCPLTDQELKREAEKMANAFSKLSELEGTLKSAKKQIESEIAKVEADLSLAVEKYRSTFEMRNVECEVEKNFQTNTVTVIRLDTLEIIRERALTGEERQLMLDLQKKEEGESQTEPPPEVAEEADLPDLDKRNKFYGSEKKAPDQRTTEG